MKVITKLEENESYDTTYINKIGHFIFTTATSNKFNSHIYATLAGKLLIRHIHHLNNVTLHPIIASNDKEQRAL